MLLSRTLQPNQTLANHELLLSLSAQDAVATTWLARPLSGQKLVVMKTLPVNALDDPELEQLLLLETAKAATVQHPNVGATYASGEEDGFLYVAAEWVDGVPLAALMRAAAKAGGIPLPIAVHIVLQLCEGLAVVHEAKSPGSDGEPMVHRAVTPHNVLLTRDGGVKLIELGIAGVLGRTSGATTFRHMLGKFSYLSPEQLWSKPVDARTDTFAVGVLLYELTTGRHPFHGASERDTTTRILSPEPAVPPSSVVPGYPPELESVIVRALDKSPDNRYPTARELLRDVHMAAPREVNAVTSRDVVALLEAQIQDVLAQQRQQVADLEMAVLSGRPMPSPVSQPPPALPRATDWLDAQPARSGISARAVGAAGLLALMVAVVFLAFWVGSR